jgi:hypothetical protein
LSVKILKLFFVRNDNFELICIVKVSNVNVFVFENRFGEVKADQLLPVKSLQPNVVRKNFEIEDPCVFSHDSERILKLKQLKIDGKHAFTRLTR